MQNDRLIHFRAAPSPAWTFVETAEAIASTDYPVVPISLLEEAFAANAPRGIGVRLGAGESLDVLVNHLERIGMIELTFPTYRDGRHYSTARILRDRYTFTGEIRAVGDVLVDQLHFMVRSGFDSLELSANVARADADAALARWTDVYQAASDAKTPVWQRRAETAA
jgi:uncharacterized protein (DUF934 family)